MTLTQKPLYYLFKFAGYHPKIPLNCTFYSLKPTKTLSNSPGALGEFSYLSLKNQRTYSILPNDFRFLRLYCEIAPRNVAY